MEFSAGNDFVKPDLIVYWVGVGTKITDTIPDDAFLVGSFSSSAALPLPLEVSSASGVLVLYSLADHVIVETSKRFAIQ